jgi:hypothetical protein
VRWFRRKKAKRQHGQQVLSHQTPPIEGDLPEDVLAEVMASAETEYAAAVRGLGEQLRGKIVTDSAGGHAGYVLRFTDGSWVAAWLDPASARMEFRTGDDEPPGDVLAHLTAVGVADGSAPLDVDMPYAWEASDIALEARSTHGKKVTGVMIGAREFSLGFPEGMELEGNVIENAAGEPCLRVFWEQW